MKSVHDLNQERRVDHGGPQYLQDIHHINPAVWEQFPVGTRVIVRCAAQDHSFFRGDETGVIEKNKMHYLGLIVRFDKPLRYQDGHIVETFNFEPDDLEIVMTEKKSPYAQYLGKNVLVIDDDGDCTEGRVVAVTAHAVKLSLDGATRWHAICDDFDTIEEIEQ